MDQSVIQVQKYLNSLRTNTIEAMVYKMFVLSNSEYGEPDRSWVTALEKEWDL